MSSPPPRLELEPPPAAAPAATRRGEGWVLALLALLTALLAIVLLKPGIALDGISYFAYLHSVAQDGDLVLLDEFGVLGVSREDFNLTPEGRVRNVFAIGSAVLWLPFYMVGHQDALLVQRLTGENPADGYSQLHVFFVYVATACFGLAALLICYRLAAPVAGPGPALHATLAVWLASPFVYYQYMRGDYAHVPSALCVALFVLVWHRTRGRRRLEDELLLGFLAGVAAMVRWQDILLLVLPLAELGGDLAARAPARLFARRREIRLGPLALRWDAPQPAPRRARPLAGLRRIAALMVGLGVGAAPQLVYWRVTLGEWLAIPQGKHFLVWNRPEILSTLFSSFHGLFGWHPLLFLAAAGLLLLARRDPQLALPLVLLFALETYINSIAWDWDAGVSFGGRRFVGLTVLFVLGLAHLYRVLGPLASGAVTALALLGNLLLLHEFHFGLIDRRWHVPYRTILEQHGQLLHRLPEVAGRFADDHLGRQWPTGTWAVLGPAAALLVATALVLAARRRAARFARAGVLALLLLAEASFVRAAIATGPSPVARARVGDFVLVDYRWYENGHYQLDPFRPAYPGLRHFLGLAGQRLSLGKIPFAILDPSARPLENASALTTCHLANFEVELPLVPSPTRAVWLAVDGGVLLDHAGLPAGRLEIAYTEGSPGVKEVIAERDVWDYWRTPPEERVLWRGAPPADLTWLRLPADSTRTPRALRVLSAPLRSGKLGPGFTIFAATQEAIDGTATPLYLATRANTDFMQDPFHPTYAPNHFPHLRPGLYHWRDVPFLILDVDPGTGRGTVITTAYQTDMRLKITLDEEPTERIYLVVDGAGIRDLPHLHVGDLLVHYDRGEPTAVRVESRLNVWDYWEDPDEALLAWRGSELETLSVLEVATDPGRTPRTLELRSAGATGNNGIVAGFAVFAITQKLAAPPS